MLKHFLILRNCGRKDQKRFKSYMNVQEIVDVSCGKITNTLESFKNVVTIFMSHLKTFLLQKYQGRRNNLSNL